MMISQVISIGPFQPLDMILVLPNEDQRRDKNQKKSTFSEMQQVWTTRCTLLLLWCGSKFNNNIGTIQLRADSQSGRWPQDVGLFSHSFNGAL